MIVRKHFLARPRLPTYDGTNVAEVIRRWPADRLEADSEGGLCPMGVHFRIGGRYFAAKIFCNMLGNLSIRAKPVIQVPTFGTTNAKSFPLANGDSGSPASGGSRGARRTLRPKKDKAMSKEVQTVVQGCGVTEIVERRLRESMYVSLRTVSCQFKDGLLTLRGIVPTFYVKQVILSLVEDLECDGIKRINDEIDVVNPRGLSSVRRK